MDTVNLKLPENVALSLAKHAAEVGMSAHDYVVQLVTNDVCSEFDDDLVTLLNARLDESNDIEESPELWAQIDERVKASRKTQQ